MTDKIPRLALLGLSERAPLEPILLGLAAAFAEAGYQPQVYTDIASPEVSDCMRPIVGMAVRHLDPWVLGPDRCRAVFARTATLVDIALIRCDFRAGAMDEQWQLAEYLNAPVLAVVDAKDLERGLPLPLPPNRLPDGVLVTNIGDEPLHLLRSRALSVAQAPLVGGLNREALEQASRASGSARTLSHVASYLANQLLEFTSIEQLYDIAKSRPFEFPPNQPCGEWARPLRIAAAWDEGFHCYLPDALDELQLLGAEIFDFAPSRCETLPENVDVVLLGSGKLTPEYIRTLASNACIQGALRAHVCENKILYAEGTGAAILSQSVELPDGEVIPMTGILPVTLRLTQGEHTRQRVEIRPGRRIWIFAPGHVLRGYLAGNVGFTEAAPESVVAAVPAESGTEMPLVVARKNCVASLAYIDFAAVPELLATALRPRSSSRSQPPFP